MEFKIKSVKAYQLSDESGRKVAVCRIGKGRYCTAYKADDLDDNRVWLVVKDTPHGSDASKEILSQCDGPHIPQLERVGYVGDDTVWQTVYYRRLTAKDKAAWKQYKLLKAANESARSVCAPRMQCDTWGYDAMVQTLNYFTGEGAGDPAVADALQQIIDAASAYGQSYTFEFAVRNLAVDSAGNLILLDPIFDLEEVQRAQVAARKKAQPWL